MKKNYIRQQTWQYLPTLIIFVCMMIFVSCGGNSGSSEKDYESELGVLNLQIQSMIANTSCNNDSDCNSIAYGSRPCGGPDGYLIYSSLNTDVEDLELLVTDYNELDSEYNSETGAISICSIELEPTIACIENTCQEQEIDSGFSNLKIVDNGAVSAEYIVTTIDISSDGIMTYLEELHGFAGDNGYLEVQQDLTFYLSDDELAKLEGLINDSAVDYLQDVEVPQDAESCDGMQGIDIDFDDGVGTTNSFTIEGTARCHDYIPDALQELLDYVDDLVFSNKMEMVE